MLVTMRHIRFLLYQALLTASIVVGGSVSGASVFGNMAMAAENTITGLRVGSVEVSGQPALRVVVETKNPASASLKLLRDPYRFVIDMPQTDWQVEGISKRGTLNKVPAKAYRYGKPVPETGRIVIEMTAPAVPVRRFTLPPGQGGHRLIFDLVDKGSTAYTVAASALQREGIRSYAQNAASGGATKAGKADTVSVRKQISKPAPAPATSPIRSAAPAKPKVSITPPASKPKKWVVFIDAGHGGKDPGAIGRSKTQEKEITLAASLELAAQLRATGVIEPVLSRSDDRYLKLRERIRLAREREADMFISLHADAAPSSHAHGISVFTLSDTASDKEAAKLAQRENQADLIGGPDLAVEDPDAAGELLRMFQRESMNQSTYLASSILRQIKDMPGGDKRGHRFAGFAVLKAPDMPSVLVEMGFITNRQDEANLNKESYRKTLMERLARAIITYLVEYGPRQ